MKRLISLKPDVYFCGSRKRFTSGLDTLSNRSIYKTEEDFFETEEGFYKTIDLDTVQRGYDGKLFRMYPNDQDNAIGTPGVLVSFKKRNGLAINSSYLHEGEIDHISKDITSSPNMRMIVFSYKLIETWAHRGFKKLEYLITSSL